MTQPTIIAFGENAILLSWSSKIKMEIHQNVVRYNLYIQSHFKSDIIETVSTYQSIAVYLHSNINQTDIIHKLSKVNLGAGKMIDGVSHVWHIPVCYDPVYGIDIFALAKGHNMSIDEVVNYHTKDAYRIYFHGFLPGFLYLGDLPKSIHTPRKSTPRLNVSKGAVAIGGEQTGIYPQNSPGGWHIIGQTPIDLFKPLSKSPSLFSIGDYIQFFEVEPREYELIKQKVSRNGYFIKREEWRND